MHVSKRLSLLYANSVRAPLARHFPFSLRVYKYIHACMYVYMHIHAYRNTTFILHSLSNNTHMQTCIRYICTHLCVQANMHIEYLRVQANMHMEYLHACMCASKHAYRISPRMYACKQTFIIREKTCIHKHTSNILFKA